MRKKIGMRKKGRPRKWFTWTLELKVDRSWVADGFDIRTAEQAHERLAAVLPFALNSEFRARILSRPPRREVSKAQG